MSIKSVFTPYILEMDWIGNLFEIFKLKSLWNTFLEKTILPTLLKE